MDETWFQDWFDEDYAALYAHRDEREAGLAVQTVLGVAPELAVGPVLDLGCGTGRHLRALHRLNPQAMGMDLSATLLRLGHGELAGRLLRGDMRALPFRDGCLSGACLWFTPFGYFSDAGNEALVRDLARVLRPAGVLVMDYLNADHLAAHLVAEDEVERNGLRVRSRRSLEGDRVVKRMRITRPDGGPVREVTESVRVYRPEELLALLGAGGFQLRQAFGDYAGGPHSSAAPRWIGVLERQA